VIKSKLTTHTHRQSSTCAYPAEYELRRKVFDIGIVLVSDHQSVHIFDGIQLIQCVWIPENRNHHPGAGGKPADEIKHGPGKGQVVERPTAAVMDTGNDPVVALQPFGNGIDIHLRC